MVKGLSQTLWIVIGIIVFLVVALVILTIFGNTVSRFASIGEANAFCTTQGATSCQATTILPVSWNAKNIKVGDELKSCFEVTVVNDCAELLGGGATGGSDTGV